MALYLIEKATVERDIVVIKFGRTIKISSLLNENFIVQTTDATPVTVLNPFKTINTITDYNQISRTLKLTWNTTLQSNKDYYIRIVNLLDAVNETVPEEKIKFTKTDDATPSSIVSYQEPDYEEVLITDNSIRPNAFTSLQIIAKNPNFYIETTEPSNGDFYIENDYNDGRIKIVFNSRPATNFLNYNYFKAQRKKIQVAPTRWETVSAQVSMHSWKPEVYIDFPSIDATPVYFTSEKTYFERGYKYRIIVSKDIGV